MKCAALLAIAALVLCGCSKKNQPPQGAEQKPGEAPAAAPSGPPPKYVTAVAQNAPAENVAGEVNSFLTEQLRIFIREKGRMPQDFAELARTRLDSMPGPPQGKKWVIDTATKEVKSASTQ